MQTKNLLLSPSKKSINKAFLLTSMLVSYLFASNLPAQSPFIISNTEYEMEHPVIKDLNSCILFKDALFVVEQEYTKSSKYKLILDIYDPITFTRKNTGVLVNEVETQDKEHPVPLKTFAANNKLYTFYIDYDRKSTIIKLVVADITGKVITQPTTIAEVSDKKGMYTGSINYDVVFSPDLTKFAVGLSIKYLMYPQDSYITIYNSNSLEKIKTVNPTQKIEDLYLFSGTFSINDNGDVICAQHISKFDTDIKYQIVAYELIGSKDSKSKVFTITDKLNIRSALFLADQNKFITAGLCNDIETKGGPEPKLANYFFETDGSGEVKNLSINYFNDDFYKRMGYKLGTWAIEKGTADKSYIVKELIKNNNDYYFMFTQGFSGTNSSGPYQLERELMTCKYSSEGKFQWCAIIPKSTLNKVKNFHYTFNGDKLYFIYAEHPSNFEKIGIYDDKLKEIEDIKNYKDAVFAQTTIDVKTGAVERKLYPSVDGVFITPINRSISINDGKSIVVRFVRKNKFSYGRMLLMK